MPDEGEYHARQVRMIPATGTQIGPYEIVAALGEGGMGAVYRARDTRLGRDVALKILHPDVVDDPDRLARFEREARAVSALNHPNIVTLHEVGASAFGPYLVLERIEGRALRDLLSGGPLPVRQLTTLAAQIAAGLAKAHEAGIVHRDLKPDNVMVTSDGFAKILDFGLARLVLPDDASGDTKTTTLVDRTASGVVLGTLGYLSPEQAAGKPADYRADQFALGAMLYEMATGMRPFKRETVLETLAATVRDEPTPVRSLRTDLPAPLAWIIERSLAKDPDDRYASTKDLARDLADVRDRLSEVLRGDESLRLAAADRPPRSRWHRGWIAAGVVVAAVAVLTTSLWPRGSSAEGPSFRPLTFRRGMVTGARFSADGKTIYYSMTDEDGASRVFVTRLDGTESRLLDVPPGFLLSVSSKDELALLLTDGRNVGTSPGTLVRVPAIGGTPRPLLDDVYYADWAPDGENLAIVKAMRRMEFPIGTPLPPAAFWARVSPSGDRLAIITSGSPNALEIHSIDGTPMLRQREPFVYGFAWRRDGRELWYTASPSGSGSDRSLYAIALDGTRRLLMRAPGAVTIYDVGPDGSSALIATGSGWASIVAGGDGQPRERTLDLLGRTSVMGLSADGRYVLLHEDREVGPGTYLRSTDGRESVLLGPDRALGLTPDGRWALVQDRVNPSALRLIPTGAGPSQNVRLPDGYQYAAGGPGRWSRDGRRLFLPLRRADSTDAPRVWMQDKGQWREVTSDIGPPVSGLTPTFAVSPDGQSVAIRDAALRLQLFATGGGTPRTIDDERGLPLHWSADGRTLFLRDGPPFSARIYRRDIVTGRVDPWRVVEPDDAPGVIAIASVLLSDDGRSYVYGYLRALNDLYVATGLR